MDLELARDGGVFPLNLYRFPWLDVDGLVLLVQLIAGGGFQFTDEQLALALDGEVVNVDVASIVRGVFANGILILIIHQELDPINSITGDRIHLMNDDAREGDVGHGQGGGLVVPDGEVVGSAVNFEALRRLDFHTVVIALVQGDMDPATIPGGHGVHQSAIHLPNLKGNTLDPLGLVRFGHLDQF